MKVLSQFVFDAEYPIAYRFREVNGQAFLDVAHINSQDWRLDKSRLHNLDWIPDVSTTGIHTHWQKEIEMTVFEAGQKAFEKMNSTLTAENVFELRREQRKLDDAEVDQIIQELDGIGNVASWAVAQLARAVNKAEYVDVVLLRVCEALAEKYNWNLNV